MKKVLIFLLLIVSIYSQENINLIKFYDEKMYKEIIKIYNTENYSNTEFKFVFTKAILSKNLEALNEFKNIDRMFLYKNFFFFITNEKKIFIFKTTDMESDELIKIIKTTGILFEKKEKPFNIYKYCKKGKSF